jgi:hypothetical protein
VEYILKGLNPGKKYTILTNNNPVKISLPDHQGNLTFDCSGDQREISVKVE